jgi:hypothetical protein
MQDYLKMAKPPTKHQLFPDLSPEHMESDVVRALERIRSDIQDALLDGDLPEIEPLVSWVKTGHSERTSTQLEELIATVHRYCAWCLSNGDPVASLLNEILEIAQTRLDLKVGKPISVAQLAKLCGTSAAYIRQLIDAGRLLRPTDFPNIANKDKKIDPDSAMLLLGERGVPGFGA